MTKDSITVYSLPACPMCKNLKNKLDNVGLNYADCEDVEKMSVLGITNVPVMQIGDGELMSYRDALQWVNRYEEENC